MHHRLSHPFWPVQKSAGTAYGLSQQWAASPVFRGWGCGPAAALMLLGYLHLYHRDGQSAPMDGLSPCPSVGECTALMNTTGRRCFPILPRWGMNGLSLAFFLNLYFCRYRMPYRAAWCSSLSKAERTMASMLDKDIPVIFSVGPDFPLFWQKHPLVLYERPENSPPAASVRAHYMVVTGMENGWLTVSSWGRKYYLPLASWREHHRYHSGHLVDGIIALRQIRPEGENHG